MPRIYRSLTCLFLSAASLVPAQGFADEALQSAAPRAVAAQNPDAQWKLDVRLNHEDGIYYVGDRLTLDVTTPRAGFLHVINITPAGDFRVLWPMDGNTPPSVEENSRISFPDRVNHPGVIFEAAPPVGRELIVCFATTAELHLHREADAQLLRSYLTRVDRTEKDPLVNLRDFITRIESSESNWTVATVHVETRMPKMPLIEEMPPTDEGQTQPAEMPPADEEQPQPAETTPADEEQPQPAEMPPTDEGQTQPAEMPPTDEGQPQPAEMPPTDEEQPQPAETIPADEEQPQPAETTPADEEQPQPAEMPPTDEGQTQPAEMPPTDEGQTQPAEMPPTDEGQTQPAEMPPADEEQTQPAEMPPADEEQTQPAPGTGEDLPVDGLPQELISENGCLSITFPGGMDQQSSKASTVNGVQIISVSGQRKSDQGALFAMHSNFATRNSVPVDHDLLLQFIMSDIQSEYGIDESQMVKVRSGRLHGFAYEFHVSSSVHVRGQLLIDQVSTNILHVAVVGSEALFSSGACHQFFSSIRCR